MATTTMSTPNTRTSSPHPRGRTSTPLPPPPPSSAVPKDFRSSLSAWWNNSSYKEARLAEERLLRRMAIYEPPAPPPQNKGWFGLAGGGSESAVAEKAQAPSSATANTVTDSRPGEAVTAPIEVGSSGLYASLRNVFIATPDPAEAPAHPADPREPSSPPGSSTTLQHKHKSSPLQPLKKQHAHAGSASSSEVSLASHAGGEKQPKSRQSGKLVDYINTLEISSAENAGSKEAVVVLHGYAAAMGFFFRNWDSIAHSSNETGRRTFFLDWLGMGLSSRPSPALLSSPSSAPIPARVARAEHFFLSSLESWRRSEGIDKMILVGHSLGGYLASAYAVRYPERVSGLILVSPAGIPHGKEYVRYPLTEDARLGKGRKVVDEQGMNAGGAGDREEAADAIEKEMAPQGAGSESDAKGEAKEWKDNREASLVRRNMMKFFVWGWERGLSPFTFLRSMGPWAPMFVGRYSSRRFASQREEDIRDLHGYIYNTSILKGSGEYCISHILAPGAYARIPIVDRINRVKVPVTFLYGDNDWMDVDGGHASVKELTKAGNTQAKVHVVPGAGHHVYLDNSEVSNRIIGEAIRGVPLASQE